MSAKEKLIELLKTKYDHFCDQCGVNKDSNYIENLANYLIANGVTVQEWVSVKDRLPISDAILILREELRQKTDGYYTYLANGGKADCAEEVYFDALEMAIAALEKQKPMPEPPKGE